MKILPDIYIFGQAK